MQQITDQQREILDGSEMKLADTHIHLYSQEFNTDRKFLIQRAIDAGITRFFLPNIDSSSISPMLLLSQQYPEHCFPMMGLHPCSVKENYKETLAIMEQHLALQKYYAIGEAGIDLYRDKTFIKEQEDAFRIQIEWAIQLNLPIAIHSRNSFDNIYTILAQISNPLRGIFHCFSGTMEEARKIIDLGFHLGIGGVVTFKNSGLDKIVQQIDLKHIVLETDAPYLAPVPWRGKRNEPAYLLNVAQRVAELKNISVEEVAEITTGNAKNLFGL